MTKTCHLHTSTIHYQLYQAANCHKRTQYRLAVQIVDENVELKHGIRCTPCRQQ